VFHHNVFDGQERDYYAIMRLDQGFGDMRFYKNTFVARNGTPPELFRSGVSSSPNVYDNIFAATLPVGDVFGKNISSTNGNPNAFYNLSSRGTNAVVTSSQPLAISGGFPNAYLPNLSTV